MDLQLRGMRALVIGASGDIGAAVARTLAAEGARVVPAGRDVNRLQALVSSLDGASPGLATIDLTQEDSVTAAVEHVETLLGGIDILVCSAMGPTFGSLWTMERPAWENALRVKYVGTADICRRVAQRMSRQGSGVIVNLIGVAAEVLFASNPVGGDVNVALARFTRFLAATVAPAGVRVVGVSPGYVRGRRLDGFARTTHDDIDSTIPLGRVAAPEEVADLIAFVASPRASYLTGTVVTLDGGLSLPAPSRRPRMTDSSLALDRVDTGGASL